jgi:hypothetical protein
MPFFKKLTGNITSTLKKASGGLDTGLRKIGNTAGSIAGYVDKATPYLSMIDPEIGAGASQLSQGLRQGQSAIKDVRGINQAVRSGNISGAIQKAKDVSQQQMPSISFA